MFPFHPIRLKLQYPGRTHGGVRACRGSGKGFCGHERMIRRLSDGSTGPNPSRYDSYNYVCTVEPSRKIVDCQGRLHRVAKTNSQSGRSPPQKQNQLHRSL